MSEIHAGPLDQADPEGEHHAGPLPSAKHPQAKRSWREKRWERRRRRRFAEEILGWILVPVILIAGYWSVRAGLNALGTSPTALVQQVKTLVSSRSGN